MSVKRMDHVGIVVDDLPAAIEFFRALGLELEGEGSVEGEWVGRVIGLGEVRSDIAMLATPDGNSRLELSAFRLPRAVGDGAAPANARGLRHAAFLVDDLDAVLGRLRPLGAEPLGGVERYENVYRLCYVRGPEGILVELAEELAQAEDAAAHTRSDS